MEYKCIKCEKPVKVLFDSTGDKIEEFAFRKGTSGTFYGGYGSAYDDHGFRFVICDGCIDQGLKSGSILNK